MGMPTKILSKPTFAEHSVFFQFFDMAKKAYEILTSNDTIPATRSAEYISGYQHGGGTEIKLNIFPHTRCPLCARIAMVYVCSIRSGSTFNFELSPIERGNLFKKVPVQGGNKTKQRLKAMLTHTKSG